jgi:signal transduction histidine kinase
MSRVARFRPLIFITDALLFLVCILGLRHIDAKAGLPCGLTGAGGQVVCYDLDLEAARNGIEVGDTLLAVNGMPIHIVEDIEFLLDVQKVGTPVRLALQRNGGVCDITVNTDRFYTRLYIVIISIVALLFFAVGVFVHFRRPDDFPAFMFHCGAIASAVMMSTTSGYYPGDGPQVDAMLRVIFYAVYALLPAIFLHFVTVFPARNWAAWSWRYWAMYGTAFALSAGTTWSFFAAMESFSLPDFHEHFAWFTATRWFLLVLVAVGLLSIRQSYAAAREESERRKLRWIVWGLFMGFSPFLFLWVLPQILVSHGLIPEEAVMLCTGMIPLAFALAIVKHHALNIDRIFNRSIVYGSVMALTLTVYLFVVGLSAGAIAEVTSRVSLFISAASAILVALIFEPLRRIIQGFVDRRYFRVRYDFRRAERDFLEAAKGCVSLHQLASVLVENTDAVIPVERIGLLTQGSSDDRLALLASRGFQENATPDRELPEETIHPALKLPLALPDQIEEGVPFEKADADVFHTHGLALVIPLHASDMRRIGFFVLGPRKSGSPFSTEDVDLLRNFATLATTEIERIDLQQEVLQKEAEARQLREVNDLKSEFVSYVSHELKTPLTSIKMFAQVLRERKTTSRRQTNEYLGIIEGEADRLNRMVSTILASAAIEKGAKQYVFHRVDILEIMRDVLRAMEYQLAKQHISLKLDLPRTKGRKGESGLWMQADPDAVAEVIINLVSNAIKYSGEKKAVKIGVRSKGNWVECTVEDRGIGIAEESIPHIFEKFYRAPGASKKAHGVGLGLSVVKHIMDAHHGVISVLSRPGHGSIFTLQFPVEQPDDSARSTL